MKNPFRTKAPPGGWRCSFHCLAGTRRRNVHGAYVLHRCAAVLSASLLTLLLAAPGARAQEEFAKTANNPGWHVQLWDNVDTHRHLVVRLVFGAAGGYQRRRLR